VPGNKEIKYTNNQRRIINRWFWRSCFSKRYSSGVLRNLKSDIEEIKKLREDKPSALGKSLVTVPENFFTSNVFAMGAVNTTTFILLLAQGMPLSFISGAPIDLGEKLRQSNRAEFHHLMPKAFLQETNQTEWNPSCLANFAFISRADNRELGGVGPGAYRGKMPTNTDEILHKAFCPADLFSDDYGVFVRKRASLLSKAAEDLCSE
jgi:hypothetical protein